MSCMDRRPLACIMDLGRPVRLLQLSLIFVRDL
jgi:hypothetical protein